MTRIRSHLTDANVPAPRTGVGRTAAHVARRRSGTVRLVALALGTLAAVLLIGPAAASAAGSAGYEYKVTGFDYNANAALGAGLTQGASCVPEDAGWGGNVSSSGDVAGLVPPTGDGWLDIRSRGTSGKVEAESPKSEYDFDFSAVHQLTTVCSRLNVPPQFTTTNCADRTSSGVEATGLIHGPIGRKVKIDWIFEMADVAGAWVPNTFSCEEPFKFKADACRSKGDLRTFTQKKFTLNFFCKAFVATPPAGSGYTTYSSLVNASGSVSLKRTAQWGG
jgi:hypothetical protein